jgi:hypothetical protein
MRHPSFRSLVWVVAFAVVVLLAATTGSAIAHELQHAAHHNAGMHGSGICAWMCATAGAHVAASIHSAPLFGLVSLLSLDSDQALMIHLPAPTLARAPPALA